MKKQTWIALLSVIAVLAWSLTCGGRAVPEVDLSPARWDAGETDNYGQLEGNLGEP